jgi:hypothetical protein
MRWFRKQRTLNEILREEAGIGVHDDVPGSKPAEETPPPGPLLPEPRVQVAPVLAARYGVSLWPPDSEALATVELPELAGDRAVFVALPGGDLLVESEEGDTPLESVAEAVEQQIERPYRAEGSRQEGTVWAFVAHRIEVAELPDVDADSVELTCVEGEETLLVDGGQSDADASRWRDMAARKGFDSYVLQADRLDGDRWELRVSPL